MILVIEGPDNVGKGTQIRNVQTHFAKKMVPVHVLHYSNIRGLTSEESREYSEKLYDDMFSSTMELEAYGPHTTVYVLDRAHLGETVYSPIYRDYSGDYVFETEKYFKGDSPIVWDGIGLITFVDEPENLINRDDGLSFSTETEMKVKEIDGFKRATQLSAINHKLLVNIHGKDAEQVWVEVHKWINDLWEDLENA